MKNKWSLLLFKCPMCDCKRIHLNYSDGLLMSDGFEICLYCGAKRGIVDSIIRINEDYDEFIKLYGMEYIDRIDTAERIIKEFNFN